MTKTAAITCNTPDDQSIWYGVGDYARAYFYVGHGGTADIETYYTRFTDNIALKIMDFDTDEVVEIGTGLSRASLREPEYKVPFMDTETDFYMLPEGEEHFSFAAEYESDYKVSLSLSSEADIVINGKQYHNKVLTVNQYVESGKELIIDMLGNEAGLNGTITISPNSTGKATSISSNGKYLFKATLSQVKELRTSNSQVLIDTIYTLKEGELYL